MLEMYIGLDIGGTKCAVLLGNVDKGIRIVDKIRFATKTQRGFDAVFEQLCTSVHEICSRNHIELQQVRAIGVSCGGPLDSRRGVVLSPPNLPGWDDIPLVKLLIERFSRPVFLKNDANACALVEWKLGAGRGCENMIFLTMGTDMGAGVICEGRLLRGDTDMAGEVGHLRLTEDGPIGFGKAGSFEGYTSGGGIARQAQSMTARLLAEGITPSWVRDGYAQAQLDAQLMAAYARNGDPHARALFTQVGKMLGRGMSLLVDAFNPERIVIGSIFMRCEDLLRAPMEEELHREAIEYSLKGLTVLPAQCSEKLGDLASIMVALHALGVDPMAEQEEDEPHVLAHYKRLFERYPKLDGCREQVMSAYLMMLACYKQGGKVMTVGNGGSCADAEHIVGELMKGFYLKRPLPEEMKQKIAQTTHALLPGVADFLQQGLPAITLTGHAALSTAVQNDVNPLLSAAQQVIGYGKEGDLVMGISTSGHAMNVALTVSVAKALNIRTLALTGGDGGRLRQICDHSVVVPGDSPADVQELHLPVYHTLCAMLEAKLFKR